MKNATKNIMCKNALSTKMRKIEKNLIFKPAKLPSIKRYEKFMY